MTIPRRTFLAGSALATVASAGCLQNTDRTDGNGNGAGEPTTAVTEDPRVDEPPYEVERPPSDRGAWDALYLCENVPSTGDLSFERLAARRPELLVSTHEPDGGSVYAVRALTGVEAVRQAFDTNEGGDDPDGPVDQVDFERFLVLVVEDAYGSGSITQHWTRVETTDRGLHLHGCHRQPYEQTDDLAPRHSVLRIERPDDFEFTRVSLTVDVDRRVHFNSTEGVVRVDDGA